MVTTSLLVGGATKPSDIENTLYVRRDGGGGGEGETRNTSWRIVSSHHLANEHPGVLCCVFVTGPIPSSLFLPRSVSLAFSPSLARSLFLSSCPVAFLFLFLSARPSPSSSSLSVRRRGGALKCRRPDTYSSSTPTVPSTMRTIVSS